MTTRHNSLLDKLRCWPWLLAACMSAVCVYFIAPQQLGLLLWALTKLSFAAYLGYWIDRGIYSYARPRDLYTAGEIARDQGDMPKAKYLARLAFAAAIRRAIIMAASIMAIGLGI